MHPALAQRSLQDKQAIRLQRYSLAAFAYLLVLLPLWAGHALGFIQQGPALLLSAVIVALNAALYVLFRAGLNLRFRDPSLTKLQVYLAVTVVMFAIYHADEERGVVLALAFLVFLFGVFRLNTREFFTL